MPLTGEILRFDMARSDISVASQQQASATADSNVVIGEDDEDDDDDNDEDDDEDDADDDAVLFTISEIPEQHLYLSTNTHFSQSSMFPF